MTCTEKTNSTEATTTASAIEQTSDVLSIRHMKAYPFYRESRSACMYKPEAKVFPFIRLCGNWLQEAGFVIDKDVTITVMKDMLIIQPAKDI